MKRIIPKSSRVKMEIVRGFSLKDLILGMFLLLLVGLLLFSNLRNKIIYIVAIIVFAILIILPMNGRKMYEEVFACLRYIFSKKKFVYKYAKHIHKKSKKTDKKVDESINSNKQRALERVTAEKARNQAPNKEIKIEQEIEK